MEVLSEAMRYELAHLGIDVVLVEPGPFSTHFFGNVVTPDDANVSAAYQHITEFLDGFGEQTASMFEDENAPTYPMMVVRIFDDLINMPVGTRPLRTIAGLDFGFRKKQYVSHWGELRRW